MHGAKKKMEEYVKFGGRPMTSQQQAQPQPQPMQHPAHPPPPVPVPIPSGATGGAGGTGSSGHHGHGLSSSPNDHHAGQSNTNRVNSTRQSIAENAKTTLPVPSRYVHVASRENMYQQHQPSQHQIIVATQLVPSTGPASAPLPANHAPQALQEAPKLRRSRTNSNRSRDGGMWTDGRQDVTATTELDSVFNSVESSPRAPPQHGRSNSMSKYERDHFQNNDHLDERAGRPKRQRTFERTAADDDHRLVMHKGGGMTVMSGREISQLIASGAAVINGGAPGSRAPRDFHDPDRHYDSAPPASNVSNGVNGNYHQLNHRNSGAFHPLAGARSSKLPLREAKRSPAAQEAGYAVRNEPVHAPQETNYENEIEGLESLRGSDMGTLISAPRTGEPVEPAKRSTMIENIDSLSDVQVTEAARMAAVQQHQQQYQQQHQQMQTQQTLPAIGMSTSAIPRPPRRQALPLPPVGGSSPPKRSSHQHGERQQQQEAPISAKNLRKRQRVLDYDEGVLQTMSYNELRGQPFDFNPVAQQHLLQQRLQQEHPGLGSRDSGASLGSASSAERKPTLEESLAAYRSHDELYQQRFFGSMTVDEWERSGDWFVDQFASIVSRLKAARQERRRVFERFENEIHAREAVVKGRIDAIGQTLGSMREEGQMLMRGKHVDI